MAMCGVAEKEGARKSEKRRRSGSEGNRRGGECGAFVARSSGRTHAAGPSRRCGSSTIVQVWTSSAFSLAPTSTRVSQSTSREECHPMR